MNTENLRLQQMIENLDGVIAEVSSAKLNETVALLKIARLDLILRANGFTETDFDAALSSLQEENNGKKRPRAPKAKKRGRGTTCAEGHC